MSEGTTFLRMIASENCGALPCKDWKGVVGKLKTQLVQKNQRTIVRRFGDELESSAGGAGEFIGNLKRLEKRCGGSGKIVQVLDGSREAYLTVAFVNNDVAEVSAAWPEMHLREQHNKAGLLWNAWGAEKCWTILIMIQLQEI